LYLFGRALIALVPPGPVTTTSTGASRRRGSSGGESDRASRPRRSRVCLPNLTARRAVEVFAAERFLTFSPLPRLHQKVGRENRRTAGQQRRRVAVDEPARASVCAIPVVFGIRRWVWRVSKGSSAWRSFSAPPGRMANTVLFFAVFAGGDRTAIRSNLHGSAGSSRFAPPVSKSAAGALVPPPCQRSADRVQATRQLHGCPFAADPASSSPQPSPGGNGASHACVPGRSAGPM